MTSFSSLQRIYLLCIYFLFIYFSFSLSLLFTRRVVSLIVNGIELVSCFLLLLLLFVVFSVSRWVLFYKLSSLFFSMEFSS